MPGLLAGRLPFRRWRLLLLALAAITALSALSGCGQGGGGGAKQSEGAAKGAMATAKPMTHAEISALKPPGPAPDWLQQALAKDVPDLYQWALAHREELQYIPCYCGCGQMPVGHMSNADCYFRVQGDQLVWEQHALG